MGLVAAAVIPAAIGVGGSLISSSNQANAANNATAAQTAANNAAIAEQQRQFNTNQANLQPFLQGGQSALQAQLNLLGLGQGTPGTAATPGQTDWAAYVNGNPDALANWQAIQGTPSAQQFGGDIGKFGQYHYQADGSQRDLSPYTSGGMAGTLGTTGAQSQQSAIDQLKASPLYQSLFRNGQDTILNNAAATGGLRGGNTQSSLANFGADTLAQVIQQQIANLGQVAGQGQAGANSIGNLGAASSGNISNLLSQNGQTQAGGILAGSAANTNAINGIAGSLGSLFKTPGFSSLFGGGSNAGTVASYNGDLTGGF